MLSGVAWRMSRDDDGGTTILKVGVTARENFF